MHVRVFYESTELSDEGSYFQESCWESTGQAVCASGEQAGGDSVPPRTEDVTCSTQTYVPSYLLPPLISVNFTTENINSIPAQSLYQKVFLFERALWQALGFFWLLVTFQLILYF